MYRRSQTTTRVPCCALLAVLAALTLLFAGTLFADTADAAGAYDVMSYGAAGDGTTDDTAAIQGAINAASRAGGGTVSFPGGTFRVTSWLYPADNVSIVGVQGETVLFMPKQPSGCFFFYGYGLQNVSIEGLTLRANGNADNVSGIAIHGAINCRVQKVQFENLDYGMKLGSGPIASGWVVQEIVARNCSIPIYASHMVDSDFTGLDLEGGSRSGNERGHCIYLEQEMRRVTFTDLALTQPSGYALHLYNGSGGTSSDLTFSNITMDAANGKRPVVISSGWSNVSFRNATMKMPTGADGVCVRLESPSGITFDGFTGTGGYALVGTYNGLSTPAQGITFRNGTYTGPSLQPSYHGERNIVDLVMDNVALNPGTASSVTTTTHPAPTTTSTTRRSTTSTSQATTTTAPSTTTTRRTTATTVPRTTSTTVLQTTTTVARSTTTTTASQASATTTTSTTRSYSNATSTTEQPQTTTTTAAPTTTASPDSLEAAEAVPTGDVAKFVLLASRRWITVSVPIMTHLNPCPSVRRVVFAIDNTEIGSDSRYPYTYWYDTRRLSSGTHHLSVAAYDRYGNVCGTGSLEKGF